MKMKILYITALLCVAAWPALASSFLLLPPSGTGNVGDNISVDVVLTPTDEIFGYSVDLTFPTFLSFAGADEKGYFLTAGIGAFWDTVDNVNGTVSGISDFIASTAGLTTQDIVLTLSFSVTGAGSGAIILRNESLADAAFDSLPVSQTLPVPVTTQDAPASAPEPATLFTAVPTLAAAFFFSRRLRKLWLSPVRATRAARGRIDSWRATRRNYFATPSPCPRRRVPR
jgi:hypothetical protein